MTRPQDYHIIILGGGIVGLSLANLLADSGIKIALIDKKNTFSNAIDDTHYDIRVSAINRNSENAFRRMNVWHTIEGIRLSPYSAMSVTDKYCDETITFNAQALGELNLGYIIENNVMLHALTENLRHRKNIHFITDFNPSTLEITAEKIHLSAEHGQTLSALLIIGADGKTSWLRKTSKIDLIQKPYHHTALVAHIKTSKPHHQTAFQHFLSEGPLAFLPLSDPYHCSIVWSQTPEQAGKMKLLEEDKFNALLAKTFSYQLGETTLISPRFTFPLHFQHAKHYVNERIALIGDAAHTIHPLAGLGLNFGIEDAVCLADSLLNSLKQHRDIGQLKTLRRYEIAQRSKNLISLNGVNLIERLFCSEFLPLQFLKKPGIKLLNKFPTLKNCFARYALGG